MKNSVIEPEELDDELFTDDEDGFTDPIEDLGGFDDLNDFDDDEF
ncbi:hypothetical protein [Arcticibacter sp.]|jgi:hypothetical protein